MSSRKPRLTDARRRALDKLLARYLELDSQRQAAFLKDCHSRWPRLSAWLSELVDNSRTISLLDESFSHLAADAVEFTRTETAEQLAPGHRLGPWIIIATTGKGGMGTVYRAERADGAFEMTVAIKLLNLHGAGLSEHLRRESRFLARLNHPSVTRLIDAGLDESAGPFVVMEWVEGTDLHAWLETENPDLHRRLMVFQQVCQAVAHAHQHQVVHGDLKPANIRIGAEARVKLLDFGVARLLGSEASGSPVAGLTPQFASPEQKDGEAPGTHSDIWSLGALLAYMVGIRLPEREQFVQPLDETPARSRQLELQAIAEKACARRPELRYPTVDELSNDLGRFEQHRPIHALPPSAGYRTTRFIRRNPVLVGGIAATFLALVTGLVATTMLYLQAEQARHQAVFERDRAEEHALQVETIAGFQSDQLAEVDAEAMAVDLRESLDKRDALVRPELEMGSDTPVVDFTGLTLELLDQHLFKPTEHAIVERFEDEPLIQARLWQSLATSRRELGLLEQAEESQQLAMRLYREHLPSGHSSRINSVYETARLHQDQGNLEKAHELLKKVAEARREQLAEDDPMVIESINALGRVLWEMGRPEESLDFLFPAYELNLESLGRQHPRTWSLSNNLAASLSDLGRYEKAETLHRQRLEWLDDSERARQERISTYSNIAHPLHFQGRTEDAIEFTRKALEKRTQRLGLNHPETLTSFNNLAFLLQAKGDFKQAERYYRKALNGRLSILGPEHPRTIESWNNIGFLTGSQDRFAEAESYLARAEQAAASSVGDHHPVTIRARSNRVAMLRELNEKHAALELARDTIDHAHEALPPGHPLLDSVLSQYARALRINGHFEEAEAVLLEHHDLLKSLGEDRKDQAEAFTRNLEYLYEKWQEEHPETKPSGNVNGRDQETR